MKLIKSIISAIIVFVFGLEVGGFGMWYFTMRALKEPYEPRYGSRTRYRTYYRDK